MLTQLTISNFAIVRELDIDFQNGMTSITGETGAGKSIAIDALSLCIGHRAEASMVRTGALRADICARFSLKETPRAEHWLKENQLDNHKECLLRRVVNIDGRSRGFINGTAVPISQLRELGQFLLQIHGQHSHQSLLKPEQQKQLLDLYANQPAVLLQMKQHHHQWQQSCAKLAQYQQKAIEQQARNELLLYQLKELNELAPQPGEYQQIDAEYKHLANSGQRRSLSQEVLLLLSEDDQQNILHSLNLVKHQLHELMAIDDSVSNLIPMLTEAAIQISEVSDELRRYTNNTEVEPTRLDELEQRLSRLLTIARKHKISPTALPKLHQQLLDEQNTLLQQQEDLSALKQTIEHHHQNALKTAKQLHLQRCHYGKKLATLISESIRSLAMPNAHLSINIHHQIEYLSSSGADRIEFLVTTNQGQPEQALDKVASGGELSRIALAIQVITAQKMDTATLIFDEVDSGISGQTAGIVGKLLRQLGESTQVVCITHLPQVAGCSHNHLFVTKKTTNEETETTMLALNKTARLNELARLLSGNRITKNTIANAKELLIDLTSKTSDGKATPISPLFEVDFHEMMDNPIN